MLAASQISIDHGFIGNELIERSGSKYFALVQHQDRRIEGFDKSHVVFDYNDCVMVRKAPDQRQRLALIFVAHAGSRLIEQDHRRVLHNYQSDFQPLLLTMRE